MSLYEAISLLAAIADEGANAYLDEYKNGNVEKALKKVDEFLAMIDEEP